MNSELKNFWNYFVWAIIGMFFGSLIGFYGFNEPLIGGTAGAILCEAGFIISAKSRQSFNDKSGS